jgi:hypothetical protein
MPYRSALGDFASAEAEAFYLEALRRMTPTEKWRAACGLWELAVALMRADIRGRHADWTDAQVDAAVAQRVMEANGAARVLAARDRYA